MVNGTSAPQSKRFMRDTLKCEMHTGEPLCDLRIVGSMSVLDEPRDWVTVHAASEGPDGCTRPGTSLYAYVIVCVGCARKFYASTRHAEGGVWKLSSMCMYRV